MNSCRTSFLVLLLPLLACQAQLSPGQQNLLPVMGKPGAFIFLADRWKGGRYVWLPISFEGERIVLRWFDEWDLSYFDSINPAKK